MDQARKTELLRAAVFALRDQLNKAVEDRNAAWLALARIATMERLGAADLRRIARRECPGDPWNTRIELETRP